MGEGGLDEMSGGVKDLRDWLIWNDRRMQSKDIPVHLGLDGRVLLECGLNVAAGEGDCIITSVVEKTTCEKCLQNYLRWCLHRVSHGNAELQRCRDQIYQVLQENG